MTSEEENLLGRLRQKVSQGDVEAEYEIAWRSDLGMGLPKDEALGLEFLLSAAAKGHVLAQNNLGARYVSGEGVPVDLIEAYLWFHKAAEAGDRKAGKNRDSVLQQLDSTQVEKLKARLSSAQ